MVDVIKSCIGTKFLGQYADLACSIALRAVKTVTTEQDGRREIDVKKWARIEKVKFIVISVKVKHKLINLVKFL